MGRVCGCRNGIMRWAVALLLLHSCLYLLSPGAHAAGTPSRYSGNAYTVQVIRTEQPPGKAKPPIKAKPVKYVSLTFDDGPDPRYTPNILNILRDKGVKATFFVVGRMVGKHPEIVVRAWMEGHEIANHTYGHPVMTKLGWAETLAEVSKCQDVLVNLLGSRPRYLRPPRGQFDSQDVEVAKAMDYRIVMWTVGIENHAVVTPQGMVDRVMSKVRNGSVILLHDDLLDRGKTVSALPLLIDRLRAEGFEPVLIPDLLAATAKDRDLVIIDNKRRLLNLNLPLKGPLFPTLKTRKPAKGTRPSKD